MTSMRMRTTVTTVKYSSLKLKGIAVGNGYSACSKAFKFYCIWYLLQNVTTNRQCEWLSHYCQTSLFILIHVDSISGGAGHRKEILCVMWTQYILLHTHTFDNRHLEQNQHEFWPRMPTWHGFSNYNLRSLFF